VDATLYRTGVGAGADRTAPTTGAPGKAGAQGPAGSSRACTWPCATPASGIVRKLHGTYLGPANLPIPPGRRELGAEPEQLRVGVGGRAWLGWSLANMLRPSPPGRRPGGRRAR